GDGSTAEETKLLGIRPSGRGRGAFIWRLTVKLSGRPQAYQARGERTISSSARGAPPADFHGPLQRLLEDAFNEGTVACLPGISSEGSSARDAKFFMPF